MFSLTQSKSALPTPNSLSLNTSTSSLSSSTSSSSSPKSSASFSQAYLLSKANPLLSSCDPKSDPKSFRIDDLIKNEASSEPSSKPSSKLSHKSDSFNSEPKNESDEESEKPKPSLSLGSSPFSISNMMSAPGLHHHSAQPAQNQLMSALSSIYGDLSCYYPFMNKSSSSAQPKPELMPLLYNSINSNPVMAAALAAAMSNGSQANAFGHNQSLENYFSFGEAERNLELLAANKNNLSPKQNAFGLSQNPNKNGFSSANAAAAAAIASSIVAAASSMSNSGNNNSSNSGNIVKNSIKLCRRRKARTVFSDQQLSGLEKRFESQKYLSTPERVELANSLGLSETQVRFNCVFN